MTPATQPTPSSAVAPPPEPAPAFILRLHQEDIHALSFSDDGQHLLSCDSQGYVAVWSLDSFRPVFFWRAHQASVLSITAWADRIVTQGRDNLIHIFALPQQPAPVQGTQPSHTAEAGLSPEYSVETNAVTHCKLALLALSNQEAWVAVPAVLEDDKVDIIHLPSRKRVLRSIGSGVWPAQDKTGTCMALQLYKRDEQIRLLVGYEDGRLALFADGSGVPHDQIRSKEGQGWELLWHDKGHKEPIMSLVLEPTLQRAWTVSADQLVCRWTLPNGVSPEEPGRVDKLVTNHPGRSSISIRGDNKILAIGGWDGSVRVHSTKSFKPLAVLQLHRDTVHAVAFAPLTPPPPQPSLPLRQPKAWLAVAGKDQRISLWELYPPSTLSTS